MAAWWVYHRVYLGWYIPREARKEVYPRWYIPREARKEVHPGIYTPPWYVGYTPPGIYTTLHSRVHHLHVPHSQHVSAGYVTAQRGSPGLNPGE